MKNNKKNKILSLVKLYQSVLLLDQLKIDVVFSDEIKYTVFKNKIIKSDDFFAEVISAEDEDNRDFIIVFYTDEDLEDTVIHELLHIKFWETNNENNSKVEHNIIECMIPVLKEYVKKIK